MLTPQQKKWVDALRSGKYKQGIAYLHTQKEEFCCLGVACVLFAKDLGIEKIPTALAYAYGESQRHLPEALVDHLGLLSPLGNGKGPSLSELNDNGMSFDKIADLIETGEYFAHTSTTEVG